MREIKFRGISKETKEWVFGGYHQWVTRQICPIGDTLKPEDIKDVIITDGFADWNMPRYMQATEIIPETLGQCAGLKDKNGKEIYEGDFIKSHYANAVKTDHVEVVEFKDGRFVARVNIGSTGKCWITLATSVKHLIQDKSVYMEYCEVIGNTYDNPELLEEINE